MLKHGGAKGKGMHGREERSTGDFVYMQMISCRKHALV